MRKILLLSVLLLSLTASIKSQELDYNLLENILEKISIEEGTSPELDAIEQLIEQPIYLKRTSIGQFLQIPGFTTSEAKTILQLVKLDTIVNFNQLFALIELSDEQKYLLQICTTFDKPWMTYGQNNFYLRSRTKDYLNEPRGFTKNKFKGDELDLYNRLTGYYDSFSFGLLTDKDAGELHLVDNYSIYISGNLEDFKFLFGDYYIETGMGNILWKSFPISKGSNVIYPALQKGTGIREYRSSIDYRNFRGAAIEKSFEIINSNITSLFWYSNTDRAGTIDQTGENITAVYRAGYYRTESEISKKDAFNETLYGSNLEWKNNFLSLGLTALHLYYDKNILSESKYAFYGKEGNMFSIYSFIDYSGFSIGGELSSDANGNPGLKAGSQIQFGNFELAAHFRSFSANFRSQYGYSFGESVAPNNEYGFYTGLSYKGIKNLLLSAYSDFYASFERTYYVPEPIRGFDIFAQADWKINSKSKFVLRFNTENKTDIKTSVIQTKEVFQRELYRIRVEFENKLTKNFSSRFRLEANYVNLKNVIKSEKGILGFIEFKWKANEFNQSGCRFSAFSTNSFESVVYQFEMAMPGYMTTIPLYGDGFRVILFTKLSPIQNIDLWFRYSLTKKNNVKAIGSGYLEIPGNKDERLMLQIDLRL